MLSYTASILYLFLCCLCVCLLLCYGNCASYVWMLCLPRVQRNTNESTHWDLCKRGNIIVETMLIHAHGETLFGNMAFQNVPRLCTQSVFKKFRNIFLFLGCKIFICNKSFHACKWGNIICLHRKHTGCHRKQRLIPRSSFFPLMFAARAKQSPFTAWASSVHKRIKLFQQVRIQPCEARVRSGAPFLFQLVFEQK